MCLSPAGEFHGGHHLVAMASIAGVPAGLAPSRAWTPELIRPELSPKARAGRARSPTVLHVLKHWAAWPPRIRWLVGIAAVVGLAIVWVLFVPVADWLAHHDVGSATGPLRETALDNARGRLLTLGAGLFAAGALLYTARNFALSRRTFELTEQGQVTDRYTKAVEQLGSDKLDVRIGGIYALERVARDSARDHPVVMAVLNAFIREHSREPWPPRDDGAEQPRRSTRSGVQAAITVIGRRDAKREIMRINLVQAGLGSADLSGADLSSAVLAGAILTGANLRGAVLDGADLTSADLAYAFLGGAYLRGAVLDGADLSGAEWPDDEPVPEGWKRDSSGRLLRADAGAESAEAT